MVSHCFIHTHGLTLSQPHSYLLDICMGFKRVQFLQLLFVRLLKHTSLKPMHCHSSSITQTLKPIRFTTTKTAQALKKHVQVVKTHAYSSNYCSQPQTRSSATPLRSAPALRRHVSHTHTQLRLARHARTNRSRSRNRNRFPGPGGRTSRTNSPKPPILYALGQDHQSVTHMSFLRN